jgi:hypothetical protein
MMTPQASLNLLLEFTLIKGSKCGVEATSQASQGPGSEGLDTFKTNSFQFVRNEWCVAKNVKKCIS